MHARLAVGCGDLAGGVAAAVEASRRAAHAGDSGIVAEAACAAAFAHLAVGDLPSLESDAAECRAAAHAARDPLRALRVQLMLAEQLRRVGRRTEAVDAIRRVTRAPAASLPPLLRRRREMLADLLIGDTPLAAVVARHVTGPVCRRSRCICPARVGGRRVPAAGAVGRRDRHAAALSGRGRRARDADGRVRARPAPAARRRRRVLRRRAGHVGASGRQRRAHRAADR